MSSKDLERGATVYELRRRAGAGDNETVLEEKAAEAQPKAQLECTLELIEQPLEMEGCCGLDRSSIEALEALLTALEPADEMRLTLALGGDAPIRLGLALREAGRSQAQRSVLETSFEFATTLVNTRGQR